MAIEKLVQQEFDFVKPIDKEHHRKETKDFIKYIGIPAVAGGLGLPGISIGLAYSISYILVEYHLM